MFIIMHKYVNIYIYIHVIFVCVLSIHVEKDQYIVAPAYVLDTARCCITGTGSEFRATVK
jgi:hypothetical protein